VRFFTKAVSYATLYVTLLWKKFREASPTRLQRGGNPRMHLEVLNIIDRRQLLSYTKQETELISIDYSVSLLLS